jgi:stage III sporulation protein AG
LEDNKKGIWDRFGDKHKYTTGILIGTLIIGVSLFGAGQWGAKPKETVVRPIETAIAETEIERTEQALERRLKAILSQVEGAGQVDVSVFLATGIRYEYAVNVSANKRVIDEKDQGGGVRLTTEDNSSDQYVLIRGNQTQEQPVVIQESSPQIQGVLIVADGAKNPVVKSKLLQATRVALGLESHRIQVLPREDR